MFSHAGWDLVFCAFGQIGHRSAAVFSGGRDKGLSLGSHCGCVVLYELTNRITSNQYTISGS
jgi:hypothetical protein